MGSEVGIEFGSKCINLFFDFFFVKLFVLKFQLQLETFYLDLTFSLMIQNALVWLAMFWRSYIPGRRTVLASLM